LIPDLGSMDCRVKPGNDDFGKRAAPPEPKSTRDHGDDAGEQNFRT
jgi:hypothetical protein